MGKSRGFEESSQTIVENLASTQQCVSYRYSTTQFIFSSLQFYLFLLYSHRYNHLLLRLSFQCQQSQFSCITPHLLLFSPLLLLIFSNSSRIRPLNLLPSLSLSLSLSLPLSLFPSLSPTHSLFLHLPLCLTFSICRVMCIMLSSRRGL